jgi:hypothetical protein
MRLVYGLLAACLSCAVSVKAGEAQEQSLDLQTTEGQLSALQSSAVSESLKTVIKAWREERLGQKVPVDAMTLLSSSGFSFSQSGGLSSVSFGRTFVPYREVDAERGAGGMMSNPPPGGIPPIAEVAIDKDQERQKACGKTVRSLREPLMVSEPVLKNRILNFNEVCLFAGGGVGSLPPLTRQQVPIATSCAALYLNFLKTCIPQIAPAQLQIKLDQLAGVILVDPDPSNPNSSAEIVCSGILIGAQSVLTAKHCLNSITNGNAVLRFLPVGASTSLADKVHPSKSGVILETISLPKAAANQSLAAYGKTAYSAETDIVVVRTASAPYGETAIQPLKIGTAKAWGRVAVAGFHRFAYRAMLMKARLENKPFANHNDLLASGDWTRAVLIDTTATCRLQSLTSDERRRLSASSDLVFGHFCQSHERGSGGAVLALSDDPADQTISLVGVHIGGQTDPANGIAVEEYGSTNYAVLFNSEFMSAASELGSVALTTGN